MNMEEIYQSIEHIAKCEMYDAIEVKYLKSKFEELQQENKQLKDKIPYIIQNNLCEYISIEKCKNKVCVNYKIQGSDSNVKD